MHYFSCNKSRDFLFHAAEFLNFRREERHKALEQKKKKAAKKKEKAAALEAECEIEKHHWQVISVATVLA